MAKDAVSEWSSASPTLDFIWFKPPSCFCARLAFLQVRLASFGLSNQEMGVSENRGP